MSICDRLHKLAVRGCLIAAILFPVDSNAQDKSKDLVTPRPHVSAEHGPVPNQDAAAKPSDSDSAATNPINGSATIKRDDQPGTGDQKREKTENRKEDREIRDVIAQESMAKSADALIKPTWVAAGIAGVGVLLLIPTLWYSRKAVIATRQSTEIQNRAYLAITPAGIFYDWRQGLFAVHIVQQNNGQTPALNVRFSGQVLECPGGSLKGHVLPEPNFRPGVNVVHPGAAFEVTVPCEFEVELCDAWRFESKRLYFFGVLSYDDVLKKPHETLACWSFENGALVSAVQAIRHKVSEQERPITRTDVLFEYADRHNDAT